MKKLILFLAFAIPLSFNSSASTSGQNPDLQWWGQQARNVTITRDDWGIAHVYGKTDAWAAEVIEDPVSPADVTATVFQALGIAPETRMYDPHGRAYPLSPGRPIPLRTSSCLASPCWPRSSGRHEGPDPPAEHASPAGRSRAKAHEGDLRRASRAACER